MDFDNLKAFITEFEKQNDNEADILDFMKVDYQRKAGEIVSLKNYVGLIQMKDGFQIQILPKISFYPNEDNGNEETKRIFLRMLRSLKDFPSKLFNAASLQVDRMNLYEVFIRMYLQEVLQLVKHGIKSGYVEQEDNLKFFRGKLLTNKHIRMNAAHKERFYVSYDAYLPNRSENRLIKTTLVKLQKITCSIENEKLIRHLYGYFDDVETSKNVEQDFTKVVMDRDMKEYESILKWSKIFLTDRSFTTFSGKNEARALLFPMEKVFESYVAQEMRKIVVPEGWEISTQDRQYHLFNEPRNIFALKPDIVLKNGKRTIILDTKWKNLYNNPKKNYGIAQSDMYQMYAYSKKYNTSEIWLLYPISDDMRANPLEKDIVFKSIEDGVESTVVKVYFVDVANIEQSLNKLIKRIG